MPSTVIGLMKGVNDRLTDVDDSFLRIVGYTRDDFDSGNMSWRDMTPAEFLARDEAGIAQALRADSGGFTMPYRKEFFRKDGSRVPVLLCCAFVPDAPPGTWMGYVVDLSTPHAQHADARDAVVSFRTVEPAAFYSRLIGELVRERTRLLAIFDNTSSMMWSVDRDLRLMTANAAFHARITKAIGREIATGELVLAPEYPEQVAEEWRAWYRRVLAGESLVTHTNYVAGGEQVAFAHVLTPYRDAHGNVIGVSGVSHDVTARAIAEGRAQQRERDLLEAQRLARVGSWDWDCATDVVTWSESLRELFAWPRNEPVPPFGDHERFYSAASWDQLTRAVGHLQRTGEPYELELELHRNGSARWILARGEPRLDGSGQLVGIHGVVMEITERHLAEEARRKLESQLLQSQKMHALGQLAGGVAHDFNNILTSILLQLGTIREEVQDSPLLAASVEEVDRSARRASSLTRQLLMFSRRQAPDLRPLEVNNVVHDFLRMLRRLIGEQYTIDFEAGAMPLTLLGDRGMIEQVIMNLAVNARDAMAPGGHVVIRTGLVRIPPDEVPNWPGARAGTFVELRVTDNGCGIPPELQPRIFEPFFTTKQAGLGTGLGLATTYGIVAQHGGWVEFTSAPQVGTTFCVRIPAQADAVDAGAGERTTERQSVLDARARTRVLLVEDEPSVRTLVERALTERGFTVVSAGDAAHALRAWTEDPSFDLVLSDMVLPGEMSGIDLLRILREQQPSLRSLLMTGYAEQMGTPEFVHLAGGQVLRKPFDVSELLDAVDEAMRRPLLVNG